MGFVQVGQHRVAYRESGDPRGSPVVLIHALASDSSNWDTIAEALARTGRRVIAVDLPGHGKSDRLTRYSLTLMEDRLAAALERLNLRQFDLIGHSLGAHLALRLAARLTVRVRRLVAECIPVPPRNESDANSLVGSANARRALWRLIRLLGSGRLVRIALLGQFHLKAIKLVLSELRRPMPRWWESLAGVRVPCLMLIGRNSGIVQERTALVVSRVRTGRLQLIGAGYDLHRNHHEEFLQAIMPFLDVQRAGRT